MRILLVKLSSMGDVIHNLPIATDIRRRYPDAAIDWVTEAPYAELVSRHPAVRRAIPVHLRALKQAWYSPAAWLTLFDDKAAIGGQPYDMVLDTQGLTKSALIAHWANGTLAGYDRASIREPYATRWYDRTYAVSREWHAVTRNRQLAQQALGTDASVPVDYGIEAAFGNDVEGRETPYVVCLTATSRADKCWPSAQWEALGHLLHAAGLKLKLPSGSAAEYAAAQTLAANLVHQGADAEAMAPSALTDVAHCLACARGVVGVDTGLAHLAVALGRPTVGLYTTTQPALTGLHGRAVVNLGGGSRATPAMPTPADVMAALVTLGVAG